MPDAVTGRKKQEMTVQEFAELAGVTVRTLHHYDRLGLLAPQRAGNTYRQYSVKDLERLEQIVALKFLGLPLKRIKAVLDEKPLQLSEALCRQRAVLESKKHSLSLAINAIQEVEASLSGPAPTYAAALKKLIEVIEMETNHDWAKQYYTPEAQAKIEERAKQWTPELQAQVSKQWTELFSDVEAALDRDPASPEAQALAQRWKTLVAGFTGGDPEISQGLGKLYQDRANWPAAAKDRMEPYSNPKVWEFIQKAFAAAKS
jgi:DNA-binding transcriptional MerR regulator